ncbi:MAG: hypothetical protein UD035_03910 [Coprococcus comes]|nr:hypothetical protein [Coprococcus comes]
MRIISQDKEFDLPYEETTIQVLINGTVAAFPLAGLESDAFILMAKYSTKEKAIKVMEMCREKYLSRMELDGGYDVVNGCYVQPNYWVLPKVFQFPADEEV